MCINANITFSYWEVKNLTIVFETSFDYSLWFVVVLIEKFLC